MDEGHKEAIKVGFNLQRKVILFVAWLSVPAILYFLHPRAYWHDLGVYWLVLGGIGLLGRTLFLVFTRNFQTGAVWFTKILTDPFHDVMIYYKAPLYLLKGQWIDPMDHARAQH